jgi:hypothetical protein
VDQIHEFGLNDPRLRRIFAAEQAGTEPPSRSRTSLTL